jgi:putative transposase
VRQGRGIHVREELQAGAFLGTDGFLDQLRPLLKETPLDPDYRKRERCAARPSLEELFADVSDKPTRNERVYQAVLWLFARDQLVSCPATALTIHSLREVPDFVGLFYSSISTVVKRVHQARKSEE